MTVHDLDTPCLLCEVDVVERNLRAMQAACDAGGSALRPHIKTHKIAELARRQLDLGAVGLTCAKLGEAEVMADEAGCDDLFVAYSLIGEPKLRRLLALAERVEVRVAVVSLAQAELLSQGLQQLSPGADPIKVRLNVDCGLGRDGFADSRRAVADGCRVAELPGLELVGVYTHEGGSHKGATKAECLALGRATVRELIDVAEALRAAGMACPEVAPGATPTAADVAGMDGVTEVRPGTYLFNDGMNALSLELPLSDCALTVLTTVVDVPTNDRVILDGGSKTFFADASPEGQRALCVEQPDLFLGKCTEEHGHAEWRGEGPPPVRLGDRLHWVPWHVCPVVNLFDEVVAVRGDEVETAWRVAARGKVR